MHPEQHPLDLPDLHQLPLPAVAAGGGRPPDPSGDGREIASYQDSSEQQHRSAAALAPATRRAYAGAWEAWQRWALAHGRRELPARPVDVADFFEHRHAAGAAPATVRMARAAIAKAHQVEHARRTSASAVGSGHTLHRIAREGRHRGRGQAAPLSWAACASRNSPPCRWQTSRSTPTTDPACSPVRSSKTDQTGRGELRYLGTPTVAAVTRWLQAAGFTAGALFRPLRPAPGGAHRAVPATLGPASVRAVIRRRAQAVDGIPGERVSGHSLRVGAARAGGAQVVWGRSVASAVL